MAYGFLFLKRMEKDHILKEEECSKLAKRISSGGPCTSLKSVGSRQNDSETWAKMSDVLRTRNDTTTAISELRKIPDNQETVNSILLGITSPAVVTSASGSKRVLGCGAPSQCLTVGNLIDRRRAVIKAKESERKRKEDERREKLRKKAADTAERERKRAEFKVQQQKRYIEKEAKKNQNVGKGKAMIQEFVVEASGSALEQTPWKREMMELIQPSCCSR